MRQLTKEDLPQLKGQLEDKAKALSMDFQFPETQDEKCILALVAEDSGKPIGGIIFRQVAEVTIVGNDPRIMAELAKNEKKIREILRRKGVEDVVGFIPERLVNGRRKRAMERLIEKMGFSRIKQRVAYEANAAEAYGTK